MPVTRHPPHRSRRAALPHRAPASGDDAQAPEGACRTRSSTCSRGAPALCPVPGMLCRVPLSPPPSLHSLRQLERTTTVVRELHRYSEAVRLPAPVHHGGAPWVPRADLAEMCQARCRASRVPHTVFPCLPVVSDPAGSVDTSPKRYPRWGLPRVRSASAPRSSPISGRNTLPAPSPVNASLRPLPGAAHDSEPVWLARPSLLETFTPSHHAGFSRHTLTPAVSRANSRSEAVG